MELTKSADYAIRIMMFLGNDGGRSRVTTGEIARAQGIPVKYVPKVLATLVRAGLLRTYQGRRGGVALARAPEDIVLLDVVEAVDGPLVLSRCLLGRGECERVDTCPVHEVWKAARSGLVHVLRGVTIAELAEKNGAIDAEGIGLAKHVESSADPHEAHPSGHQPGAG